MRLRFSPTPLARVWPNLTLTTALSIDTLAYTVTLAYFALAARRHDDMEITMELAYAAITLRLDSFNRSSGPPNASVFVTG